MFRAEKMSGRSVHNDGKEYLYFSGTSYLGLSHNNIFKAYLKDGMDLYGSNFGGSRRSNLQIPLFEEAEDVLAQWIGTESALTVSSGTMAGQLVVKTLQSLDHPLFFAPGTHPALDAQAHHFEGTFQEWTSFLGEILYQDWPRSPVLAFSSIDVLHVHRYELEWIEALPSEIPIIVLIDDSHGFGVYGENGAGIFPQLPKHEHIKYIIVSSLGKACGLPGGVIACDASLKKHFWDHPFFGGASPLVPAYVYSFLQSQELIAEQRKRLHMNIQYFLSNAPIEKHFQFLPDYPVFYSKNNSLADFLAGRNIIISSFPYPGPKDPLITRIVLSASHEQEDLERLIKELKYFFQKDKK